MEIVKGGRSWATSLCILGVVGGSVPAHSEEDGIRIGEGRLHPFLNLDGRYDSFATLDAQGNILSDFLFDIEPGFKLKIASPVVAFELGGEVDEVLYLQHSSLNRTLADADLGLDFFHAGPVELDFTDHFARSNNGSVSVLPFAIISDFNDAGARFTFRPGGGALSIEPSYHFIYEHFDDFAAEPLPNCPDLDPGCDPQLASDMDHYDHHVGLDVRYKFLPKTALLLSGNFGSINYVNPGTGSSANAPLDLFDATLGLAGLLTDRIELVVRAGYSQTFLSETALNDIPHLKTVGDDRTVVGQLQVGYLFSETGNIRIGYLRALLPAPTQLAFFTDDRPYLTASVLLAGRLTLQLNASYDIYTYAENLEATGSRTDQLLHLNLGPEYEFARWFRAALAYDLTSHGSNDTQAFSGYVNSSPLFGGPAGYVNHEVSLRLTFIY